MSEPTAPAVESGPPTAERAHLLRTSAAISSLGSLLLSLVAVAGCRFLVLTPRGMSTSTQIGLFEYEHQTGRCIRYAAEYVKELDSPLVASRTFAVLSVLLGGAGVLKMLYSILFLRTRHRPEHRKVSAWNTSRWALSLTTFLQSLTLVAFNTAACKAEAFECKAGPGAVASIFAFLLWGLSAGLAFAAPPPDGPIFIVRRASSEEIDDLLPGKATPPSTPRDDESDDDDDDEGSYGDGHEGGIVSVLVNDESTCYSIRDGGVGGRRDVESLLVDTFQDDDDDDTEFGAGGIEVAMDCLAVGDVVDRSMDSATAASETPPPPPPPLLPPQEMLSPPPPPPSEMRSPGGGSTAPTPVLSNVGRAIEVPEERNGAAETEAQSRGGGGGTSLGGGSLRQRAVSKWRWRQMVNPDGSVTVTERVEGGAVRVTTPREQQFGSPEKIGPTNERGELLLEARRVITMVNPDGTVTEGDVMVYDPEQSCGAGRSAVMVAVSEEEEGEEEEGQQRYDNDHRHGERIASPGSVEASLLMREERVVLGGADGDRVGAVAGIAHRKRSEEGALTYSVNDESMDESLIV